MAEEPVLATNMFNQIHGNPHTFALGSIRFEDQGFTLVTTDTHAIWSEFSCRGSQAPYQGDGIP